MLHHPQPSSPLRIRLVDFSPADVRIFSAVLDLAEFGLDHHWQLSDEPETNACLIKQAPGAAFNCGQHSHYFNYAPSGDGTADHTILYDEAGIPLLHELIKQLNHASAQPHLATRPPENSKPTDHAPADLPTHLLKADSPLVIHLGTETVYVNPRQHCFYYPNPLEQLDPHLCSNVQVSIEGLASDQFNERIRQANLPAQPLKHLIWYTTFITSNGALMDTLSERDVVRLNNWPYLGVSSRHYIKLATYLKNHRACFADAIQETGIAANIANNFYNASHLAGLTDIRPPTDIQPTDSEPKAQLSFLDKIKNRLRH